MCEPWGDFLSFSKAVEAPVCRGEVHLPADDSGKGLGSAWRHWWAVAQGCVLRAWLPRGHDCKTPGARFPSRECSMARVGPQARLAASRVAAAHPDPFLSAPGRTHCRVCFPAFPCAGVWCVPRKGHVAAGPCLAECCETPRFVLAEVTCHCVRFCAFW